MLQHFIIQFPLCFCLVAAKESFKLLALKVVAVTYERWSLTRGSKYSDLIWETGYSGKLVAKERWLLTRAGSSRRVDCN